MQTKNTIKPLFDNVLVRPLQAETKTASGIILPDSVKEKPQMGEVVEIGMGKMEDGKIVPVSVKKGQKVMYKKWGPGINEIKVNGEDLLIVSEKEIIAIIE